MQSKDLVAIPSGHTQSYHVDVSGHDNWGGHKVQASAGSTGVAQLDLSNGSPYVGLTLAIAPGGSAQSGTQTGRTTETVYDDAGRTVAARMNSDPWTCTTYDDRGRATQTIIPTINGRQGRTLTTNYAYQGSPLKSRAEDNIAGNTIQEVDLLGRAIAGTDQFGNVSSVAYDNFGRVTSRTSPAGTESFTYDNYNRVTSYLFNGTTYATVAYDALSRVQDITYDQAKPAATGGSGATPTVHSSTSGTVASGNLTLTKPTGTTTGDLLVMTASADLDASENVTYTIPSDWTQLLANTRSDAASAGNNLQVWYKQAGSSEPSDYTITPDHSNRIGGSITRITGHDTANPIDVQAVTASLTGEASAPSVTTTVANTQLLRIATWDQSRSLVTNPIGHTQAYSVDVSGHDNWGVYKEQATAGATGTAQWDLSGSSPYVGFTVAIKPSASGGGTTSNPMKLEQIKRDSLLRTNGATFRFSDNKAFDETVTMSQSSKVTGYTDLFNSISATNSYSYDKAGRLLEATIDNLKHTYGYGAPNASTCNQASANLTAHKNSNRTTYLRTNLANSQQQASHTYCYDQADRLLSTSDPHVGSPTYDDHGNTTSFAGNSTPITLTYDANDQNNTIQQGSNKVEYLKAANGAVLRKKEYNGSTMTKSYRYLNGGSVLQSCSLTDDNACTTSDTYLSLPGNVTLTLSRQPRHHQQQRHGSAPYGPE